MPDKFDVDAPVLRLTAQLAGIAPSRLAAAFNKPEQFMQRISADELMRFRESCDRLAEVQTRMIGVLDAAAQAPAEQ